VDQLAWVNLGGKFYRVVSEHNSKLGLEGWNVFFMHTCRLYMLLLCMRGIFYCYSCVVMSRLTMWILGCACHECVSVVYAFVMHVNVYILLCMHYSGYGYACIVGQKCIVRSSYVIFIIMMLLVVMVLMCWLR